MHALNSILQHPVAFAAGLFLILAGMWLLQKLGKALLVFLAIGLATIVSQYLVAQAWVPDEVSYRVVVYAAFVLLGVVASRHPVIACDAELMVVLVLCLVAGNRLADWLVWPIPVVWGVLLGGVIFIPGATIGALAAAIFSYSMQLTNPWETAAVFVVCVAVLRLESGRWTRGHWDPQLTLDLRTIAHKRSQVGALAEPTIPVVFRCTSSRSQQMLVSQLKRSGTRVHEFLDGSAGAEIPVKLVRSWRQSWGSFVHLQPDFVYSGLREVTLPPRMETKGVGIALEEAAARLRSDHNDALPDDVATGKGITVAVLDTGINAVTSALRSALVDRVSFVPGENADDACGHGTGVGACVVAVAKAVRLVSVKVLDGQGRGTLFSVLQGIQYVAEHRDEIHAANLSLGAACGDSNCPMCRSVDRLAAIGVPSCAAIGNSGTRGAGSVECPGSARGTLGVAAVDVDGKVAPWSSRGPTKDGQVQKPDLACIGVGLQLPGADGGQVVASGTSFASPLAAGILAAALQLCDKKLSVESLYLLLRRSCTAAAPGSRDPNATGSGIINLLRVAENTGANVKVSKTRGAKLRKMAMQTAALAAGLLLLIGSWHFGLDHVGEIHRSTDNSRSSTLVGRVRFVAGLQGTMIFDDGTGTALLQWDADAATMPEPGTIVLLRAQAEAVPDPRLVVLHGQSRFVISSVAFGQDSMQ